MKKEDFPLFKRRINNREIIYLDSAATSQKPYQVIDAITDFYENHNSNVHRGIYSISEEATELYEGSREKTASFVKADKEEIIFTKGTTESLNFLASTLEIKKGDEVLISELEHHSNIVPWQQACKLKGGMLKYIKVNENGELDNIDEYLNKKTKIVSLHHVSNFLGSIVNVREIARKVHDNNSIFIVDGAQSVPHMNYDVEELDIDFLAFSGHKMLGPTGIGVLYGKKELLEKLKPYQYGGNMINEVKLKESSFNELPFRFEAGTPNIAGAIGLGAAINYLQKTGMENIEYNNRKLVNLLIEKLKEIPSIEFYGKNQGSLVSFNFKQLHPHDVSTILDKENIFLRAGHHCVMPFHRKLKLNGSIRASFYLYNNEEDVNALAYLLEKISKNFTRK